MDAEQLDVEHGVSFSDQPQLYQGVQVSSMRGPWASGI